METKMKPNYFKYVIIFFFIIFIALYFTQVTDLYQYNQYNKMIITKEAMQRFESDVESGKDITISDYLDTVKDYSNGVSDLGYKTSNFVNGLMSKGIKRAVKFLVSFLT